MKRFDYHDAIATAAVERTALTKFYTTVEGGEWQPALSHRWSRGGFAPHSLEFTDGQQWDEHNGWRKPTASYVPRAAIAGWHD